MHLIVRIIIKRPQNVVFFIIVERSDIIGVIVRNVVTWESSASVCARFRSHVVILCCVITTIIIEISQDLNLQ